MSLPLRPGIDYYIENGLYVFTAAYLLKRGYCCGSGCRHCPYDKDDRTEPPQKEQQPICQADTSPKKTNSTR